MSASTLSGVVFLTLNVLLVSGYTYHSNEFSFRDESKTNSVKRGPPDHTDHAKMARYLVHKAGEKINLMHSS